jgi:hypothetical protein
MRELGNRFISETYLYSMPQNFSDSSTRLDEARMIKSQSAQKQYDIFISHSSIDKKLIMYLRRELNRLGYSVYIDWIEDSDYGRDEITPVLKTAMTNSQTMLYIHTYNAENSKWTPWEIGYFDSSKTPSRIGIMPILHNNIVPSYSGQEYLRQYNQIGTDYLPDFVGKAI